MCAVADLEHTHAVGSAVPLGRRKLVKVLVHIVDDDGVVVCERGKSNLELEVVADVNGDDVVGSVHRGASALLLLRASA